jgi:hypothetical protein
MCVSTNPIPIFNNTKLPPIEHVILIVDNQSIADKFNESYLRWSGGRKNILVYGGVFKDNKAYPVSKEHGAAMTQLVGVPYKSHRSTTWDNTVAGIYDYRSCAFNVFGGKILLPWSDQLNKPSINNVSQQIIEEVINKPLPINESRIKHIPPSSIPSTPSIKQYELKMEPVHQLIELAHNIVDYNNLVNIVESNTKYNSDGTKLITIVINAK